MTCGCGTIATNAFILTTNSASSVTCAAVISGTGVTTATAGKLLVKGNHLSATGAVTVQTGATLGCVFTVYSGGILSPGNSPGRRLGGKTRQNCQPI